MFHFSIDVLFDSDGIVVTSLEKWVKCPPRSLPFKLIWDIDKTQQMYRFGIDVMFGSGNFVVTSKVKVKVIMQWWFDVSHVFYRLGEIRWTDRQVMLTYLTLKSRSTVKTHLRYW